MNHFKYKLISALCLSTLALTGCNDDNTSNSTTSTTNVSGTAAVGAAITGANVVLNCGGSSTFNTTTNTNGVFNVTVPTANLPCAASISGGSLPAGQTLHSVTTTAGANVTVNVNPLTDLVLIKALQAGGVDAAAWLAHPVSTNLPTAAAITTASNAIKTALIAKGYAYPTSANFNPITSAMTPASPTDTYDSLLDALAAAITTAGSTYPQLVTSFIGGGSFPTAPITPPAGGVTCASINKQKAALSDLTQFVGKYLVKIGSSTTTTSLTIAANGDISMNGKTATASDICGPFVQSNGQGLLILAKNTANIQVNVFKDTAGKITTEGPDFTGSTDTFFGELNGTAVTPTPVCTAPSISTTFNSGLTNLPYTNGQKVCFTASATTLAFNGKTLSNPVNNTAVSLPFTANTFTDGTNQYEVILNSGSLFEINFSYNGTYSGQFAP